MMITMSNFESYATELDEVVKRHLEGVSDAGARVMRNYRFDAENGYSLQLREEKENIWYSRGGEARECVSAFIEKESGPDNCSGVRFSAMLYRRPYRGIEGFTNIDPELLPREISGVSASEYLALRACVGLARWARDAQVIEGGNYQVEPLPLSPWIPQLETSSEQLLAQGFFHEEVTWRGGNEPRLSIAYTKQSGDQKHALWEQVGEPELRIAVSVGEVEQEYVRHANGLAELKTQPSDIMVRDAPFSTPCILGFGGVQLEGIDTDVAAQKRHEEYERQMGLYKIDENIIPFLGQVKQIISNR